jgi:hypothetical protein
MNLDRIHIFIILMLALICSSCLGSFMREGYENDNDDNNKYPNVETDNQNLDPEDPSKTTNSRYSNYDKMYNNLDRETVAYSNSKLSKDKKIGPHRSKNDDNNDNNDDDNESNNINSYGNVNKYPNVENDNMLMAGKKGKYNKGGGSGSSVPGSQIPKGSEDLYMLKSEMVPPVCPACPAVTTCPSTKEKCPPCPPCARCPEPAFECKKVPNYSGQNDSYLPQPVMSDFSQFGL